MLQQVNRLKKRKTFNYIYKNGNYFSSKFFVLYCLNANTRNAKVGFSISKKIGKAVERNLLKRRLRVIVRELLPNLKQNANYVLLAKPISNTLEFALLKDEVYNIFLKSDFYKN